MTRIRFEDLPSTNTPRNAENLNKLNNVVISSTEPTTGEEVWIQKSKNIFDKNGSFDYGSNNTGRTFLLSDGTIKTTANWDEWAAAGNKVEGILPNTNYTLSGTLVSSTGTGFHNIALIIVKGYANGSWHNIKEIGMDKPKDFYETFNSGEYANIFVSFNTRGTIGKNYEAIFDNIQIEQGSIATSYEPYIDKKIYVKNDNGGYDEFYNEEEVNKQVYSTSEQRIGTWIDGKPLYRKIFKRSFSRDWSDFSISDLNVDTVYINYGKTFANFTVGTTNYVNGQFYASETDFFRCFISKTNKTVQVAFASQMTNREATIVVEYTKTTD